MTVLQTRPDTAAVGLGDRPLRASEESYRAMFEAYRRIFARWHPPGNAGFITVVEDAARGVLVGGRRGARRCGR